MKKSSSVNFKKLAGYTQLCQKFGILSEQESKEILQKLSEHKT